MSVFVRPGFFRLALALAVVASHLTSYEIGRPAVFAFFALSGFWVMRMYDEKYRHAPNVTAFYVARLLRIWLPFAVAYLAMMAMTSLVTGTLDSRHVLSLGILGLASGHHDLLGVSWSLDIELQFYLLVPAIWLALHCGFDPRVVAAVMLPLTVLGWWLQLQHGIWTVLSYLPAFAAGIAIWYSGWRPAGRTALVSIVLFALAAAIVWLLPVTRSLLLKEVADPLHEDWFGMTWIALLLPFIAYNVRERSDRLDQHLGNFSYALYITHWPVIWMMKQALGPLALFEKAAAVAVVVAVAIFFYLVVDRPAERLRQLITARMLRPEVKLQPL
jgi:peptidoglycan/LPS O-acetylase OafA/YrhL